MNVIKFSTKELDSAELIQRVIEIIKTYQNQTTFVVLADYSFASDILIKVGKKTSQKNNYKTYLTTVEKCHIDLVRELIPIQNQSSILAKVKKYNNQIEDTLESVYILEEFSKKIQDKITVLCHKILSEIVYNLLKICVEKVVYVESNEHIVTNRCFTKAEVKFKKTQKNLQNLLKIYNGNLIIMAGNTGACKNGNSTTFGKKGSDYTAAIIASSIGAKSLQLYNKNGGIFTVNRNIIPQAQTIKKLSYREAFELSHFGADTLYPPTLHNIVKKHISIVVQSIFKESPNTTLIHGDTPEEKTIVKGISHIESINLITVQGNIMVGVPGFARRVFQTLAKHKINVVFISQASSEQSICIGVDTHQVKLAEKKLNKTFQKEIQQEKVEPIEIVKNLAIVALVGNKMKNHQGTSSQLFQTLAKQNVNIRAIAQSISEKNISVVIDNHNIKKALKGLYQTFFSKAKNITTNEKN